MLDNDIVKCRYCGVHVVPKADGNYIRFMEERNVESAVQAFGNARPARAGLVCADATDIGTNRRSPDGPRDDGWHRRP